MEVIVWQVEAFGKLREQQGRGDKFKLKYTMRMMQTAYQGLLPIVAADPKEAQTAAMSSMTRGDGSRLWRRTGEGSRQDLQGFGLNQSRVSSSSPGQHIVVGLQPGVSQCVYADMRGNVLVHAKVPELGLHAIQWAVVSWAASQKRRESVGDAKYFYRLPSQMRMRNTRKRENLSAHTDDVVGEVKHAARRLRKVLLLQRGRGAIPKRLDEDVYRTPAVEAALRDLSRQCFLAWREAASVRHARRMSNMDVESKHGSDVSPDKGGGAPDVLYLGLDNSLARTAGKPLCRLTLFAAYWLDNRTGLDLSFQDHESAPRAPILLGARIPCDTTSVLAPGSNLTQIHTPGGGLKDIWGVKEASEIAVAPVLLNKQDATKFALVNEGRKRYSQSINIKTVGMKGTHTIRGQDPSQQPLTNLPSEPSTRGHLSTAGSLAPGLIAELETSPVPSETDQRPVQRSEASAVHLDILPMVASADDENQEPAAPTAGGGDEAVAIQLSVVPEASLQGSPTEDTASVRRGRAADLERITAVPNDEEEDSNTAQASPGKDPDTKTETKLYGQREYIFTVEVAAGPPSSVFRHTKVLTIKPKFVLENQTGMRLEVKQRGTPDLGADMHYGPDERCACRLPHDSRAPMHFDDADEPKQLIIRPIDERGRSNWHWSGSFAMRDRDEYFGLRVRLISKPSRGINIPVNCTVGPSGTVLITFKSPRSIPPYRIENHCEDVFVYFAQSQVASDRTKWNWLQPQIGGACMAYAWDEPIYQHRLTIQAHVKARPGQARPVKAYYSLEHLGPQAPMSLPSPSNTYASSVNMRPQDDPEISKDLKDRVSSLLAAEFSRKVYVTVFADGPTRVLHFSDVPNLVNPEADLSILDLAARLKQVEAELQSVSVMFAKQHGRGELTLDLYGRGPAQSVASSDMPSPHQRPDATGSQRRSRLKLRQRQGVQGPAGPTPADDSAPKAPSPAQRFKTAASSEDLKRSRSGRMEPANLSLPRAIQMPDVHAASSGEIQAVSSDEEEVTSPRAAQSRQTDATSSTVSPVRPSLRAMTSMGQRDVQGTAMMRQAVDGDSALLLGGDLLVSIREAEGLKGTERYTHTFARVRVGAQYQLTSVQWASLAPQWDEVLTFRDVSAAAELVLELWDVGGLRNAKHLEVLANDPNKVISNSRFMGRLEVPLSETLSLRRGGRRWFTLMRNSASDDVHGRIRLGFTWDVSARSLLQLKLDVLERVYAQRLEILCMLKPVPIMTSQRWISAYEASKQAAEKNGSSAAPHTQLADMKAQMADNFMGTLLAELQSTLHVDIVEARGLQPRKGVVVAFQANQLPCPEVEVSVPGQPAFSVWADHTLKPRFEDANRGSFKALHSKTPLTVRLYDRKSGRSRTLLGSTTFSVDSITGNEPVYVWLPLQPRPLTRISRLVNSDARRYAVGASHGGGPMQVFMRLQWERQVVRGQSMRVEVALEGIGVSVMGGLQDELFNLTMDKIEWSAERTRLETEMRGSIKRLQLDNQMLDATQPVVLAPASAAHAHSETAASLRGMDAPLITFAIVRSYANNATMNTTAGESAGMLPTAGSQGGGVTQATAEKTIEAGAGIWSFKLLSLNIGELDFSADDGFLEAILSFIVSVPTADIWQDEAWREQQRRLLTAQFGPREVESLAMNAVLPLTAQDSQPDAPLFWVQERELHELEVLRDQSSYHSWYFIEHADIGNLNANVTIALTSSVLSGRGGVGTAAEAGSGGLFSRVIGASGFQLINVNNVPLSLRGWHQESKLLGRNALINSIIWHYRSCAIQEAHKVLGGAGPAIAAVPLTAIWAGTSVVSLLASVGSGKVGPVGVVQRFGFVLFMSVAGIISSFSRIGLAAMTAIPPERSGYLSDRGALSRAVQRPANAFEAFSRANEELVAGFLAALYGIVLDPTRGYHQGAVMGHIPDAIIGCFKSLLGIVVRPAAGMTEWVSKGTHGLGLVCLGRDAILGSAQRRMRAPGSLVDEAPDALDDLRGPELLAQRQKVLAAWQRSLPNLFPAMQEDTLAEVLSVHEKRVLLLTDQHVAALAVKGTQNVTTYRALWLVALSEIEVVRGDEDKLRMVVGYSHVVNTGILGKWTIPHRKTIKCSSRDMLERVTVKVNRHMRAAAVGQKQLMQAAFDTLEGQKLTFLDAPYHPC
ncbi:hypothetical protein WJX73_008605 [Symbiochloris irregularis]|uniref:C2 domain-containing protein n=1 Tax=Symbiochloris irregularis TaxID=706552 RepID=A0AAW1NZP7_9CHLO